MDSLGDYVIVFCGFGVVCCGAGVLAMLALGKLTGASMLFPALTMFSSMLFREKDSAQDEQDPEYRRPRRKGLSGTFRDRVQAAKREFNADVARRGKSKRDSLSSPIAPQDFRNADSDDDFDPPSLRSNSNRPRRDMRHSRQDSAEDEVFGGMFDEDGDGFPDV